MCGAEGKSWWAYQYTENEIRTPEGTPYSLDIWNDYRPMCPSCHATLDWQDPERRRRGEATLRANAREAGILGGAARARQIQEDPEYIQPAKDHGKWLGSQHGSRGGKARAARYYTDPEYAEVVRAAAAKARAAKVLKAQMDPAAIARKAEKERLRAAAGRRLCDECGLETTGSGLYRHQKKTGHAGVVIPTSTDTPP